MPFTRGARKRGGIVRQIRIVTTSLLVAALCTLAPTSTNSADAASTLCGAAGYNGPIGCVLLTGAQWAPSLASLGNLDVYNNSTSLSHFGPDIGYSSEYQCTELAIRFAALVWGEGRNLAMPEDAWLDANWDGSAQGMWAVAPNLPIPLQQIANGTGAPQFGDLIIFRESGGPGHVGVVVKVANGRLYFVGENQADAPAEAWIPINSSNRASPGGNFSNSLQPMGWLRGPSWAIQTSPPVTGQLNGVSCPSTNLCVAVGLETTGATDKEEMLIEKWNGSSWATESAPSPTGSEIDLNGVSCSSTKSCVAVGDVTNDAKRQVALAMSWNGSTWTLHTVPMPHFGVQSKLESVSCSASQACTAVGDYDTASTNGQFTLIERWNGKNWTVQTNVISTGTAETLEAVSCPSSSRCLAIGTTDNTEIPLFESWSGRAWIVQADPSGTSAGAAMVYDLSCASSTSCIAVGGIQDELFGSWEWNGTDWVTLPDTTATFSGLEAVDCTSVDNCEAVGETATTSTGILTAQWLGTSWTVQSAPGSAGIGNGLLSVACTTSGCTAVGYNEKSAGDFRPLVEYLPQQ